MKGLVIQRNESITDHSVRGAGAVVAFLLAFFAVKPKSPAGIALIVMGTILGATAALGFCPLYRPFGLNTCPINQR